MLLFPAWAAAEESITNGVKVGEGRVHPFIDVEVRYDSAAGLFGAPGATTLSPEAVTHFRPGLQLELPGSAVQLSLAGFADYVLYTGLLSPGSRSLSRLEANVNLDAAFNRSGPVEFAIGDTLTRSDRTNNAAIGVGVLSLFNEARVAVPIHPGGGALEVTPKAAWTVEFFEPFSSLAVSNCPAGDRSCDPSAIRGMNYSNYRFGLEGRWKFLPKTAIVLDSSFDTRTYVDSTNPSPLLLKAQLGLAGLVSPKIATVAKVGWGHDLAGSGAQTVVGHLELSYLMSETASVKAGYLRSLDPVPTFGVYGDDRAYFEGKALLGGRLTLHGYAALDFLSFYAGSGRKDTNVTVDAGPEYQFTPWMTAALGYNLGMRVSSSSATTVNFTRHEGYARVTLTY